MTNHPTMTLLELLDRGRKEKSLLVSGWMFNNCEWVSPCGNVKAKDIMDAWQVYLEHLPNNPPMFPDIDTDQD